MTATTAREHPSRTIELSAERVGKDYGGVAALKSVDFRVRSGRVVALFGENGAGKSTLMKVLSGVEQPTRGRILINGEEVAFRAPRSAAEQGVVIIHQELNLFPNLSVAENLFVARELGLPGLIDMARQRQRAEEQLIRLREPIDPTTLVGSLQLGQQQIVEIARALSQDARILIMDEPTSALGQDDVKVLFRIINELRASGVGIVYISHHLDEALYVADDVVVMRDGSVVAEAEADDVNLAWITKHMLGKDHRPRSRVERGSMSQPLLELQELTVERDGRRVVDSVSLTVHAGEVVGLYGLMGSGRTEILETAIGRLKPTSGTVTLEGNPLERLAIADRIQRGLALVPEDRRIDGLMAEQSIASNLTLSGWWHIARGFWISKRLERTAVERLIGQLRIKCSDGAQPVSALSGGNQQKVVVGRALLTGPTVLLLDEPTRGVDVGAKAEIFQIVEGLRAQGLGILLVFSELDEIVEVVDRALVMRRGRIVKELAGEEITEAALVAAASGEGTNA